MNVTIYLYKEQIVVSNEEMRMLLNNMHTLVCTIPVILAEGLYASGRVRQRCTWFINTVALAALTSTTLNTMSCILSDYAYTATVMLITLVLFAIGLYYGFRKRQLFYIAAIPFCALLILNTVLLKALMGHIGDASVALLLGLVLIAGTTVLVSRIVKLKKQWHGTATE